MYLLSRGVQLLATNETNFRECIFSLWQFFSLFKIWNFIYLSDFAGVPKVGYYCRSLPFSRPNFIKKRQNANLMEFLSIGYKFKTQPPCLKIFRNVVEQYAPKWHFIWIRPLIIICIHFVSFVVSWGFTLHHLYTSIVYTRTHYVNAG